MDFSLSDAFGIDQWGLSQRRIKHDDVVLDQDDMIDGTLTMPSRRTALPKKTME
jgi:hypothetical protein